MNNKGAKRVFQYGMQKIKPAVTEFAKEQIKHPAAGNFVKDAAMIGIASGGNPYAAAPMLGARAAQEGADIMSRTANHYLNKM